MPSSVPLPAGPELGLALLSWQPGRLTRDNGTATVGVVDFTVLQDFKAVDVHNLTEPVEIHAPISNQTNLSGMCTFFSPETSTWKTDSCELLKITLTEMVCMCNHCTCFGSFLMSELQKDPFQHFQEVCTF